jgi:hypothetical protein
MRDPPRAGIVRLVSVGWGRGQSEGPRCGGGHSPRVGEAPRTSSPRRSELRPWGRSGSLRFMGETMFPPWTPFFSVAEPSASCVAALEQSSAPPAARRLSRSGESSTSECAALPSTATGGFGSGSTSFWRRGKAACGSRRWALWLLQRGLTAIRSTARVGRPSRPPSLFVSRRGRRGLPCRPRRSRPAP